MKALYKWFSISAIVIALDFYTKHLIQGAFQYGDHLTITSFFDLVRYHNEGAAFSFLANAGGWQKLFFSGISIVAIIVITYLIRKHRPSECVAKSFQTFQHILFGKFAK